MNHWKSRLRALAAVFMILVCAAVFLVPVVGERLPAGRFLEAVQLIPALVAALSGTISGVISVAVLLAICLVFGRIYCAVICPLGIFQDGVMFLTRLGGRGSRRISFHTSGARSNKADLRSRAPSAIHRKKSQKRGRFGVTPALTGGRVRLWYGLMVFAGLAMGAGSLAVVNLLDPFSIFGRFCAQLFLPLVDMGVNIKVAVMETLGIYGAAPRPLRPVVWPFFWGVYLWLILVVVLAMARGRLYCNSLCPVGAFFSLLSRVSAFQFSLDLQQCTGCGRCNRICRADCIDLPSGRVDMARCVVCFDCVDVCPETAVSYTANPSGSSTVNRGGEASRRTFFYRILTGTAALSGGLFFMRPRVTRDFQARASSPGPLPAVPPGGTGIDRFVRTCTGCQACVAACPEQVLQPALAGYGSSGLFQPRMDFNHGSCAYTCHQCARVCPSGAICALSLDKKQRTRIGNVRFEEKKCLVYTHRRDCGACAEVCPTHAVYTVLENRIHHPRIYPDACIGCGACQKVCPVVPKAIHVTALAVHEPAGPPFFLPEKKGEMPGVMSSDDPFPF